MATKTLDLITETDARNIEPGSTIRLAPRGIVTPLAADTLRARRVTGIADDGVGGYAGLVPPGDIRRVAIAADHSGVALKAALVPWLRGRGLAVADLGVADGTPADYPDTAAAGGRAGAR